MYRVYLNLDYPLNTDIDSIPERWEEKHTGEYDTEVEAMAAIKKNKKWLSEVSTDTLKNFYNLFV
jgi:hypothetical protein